MEEQNRNHSEQDEIDLSYVFRKISNFFKRFLVGFLHIISFYYKKKWLLLTLVLVGGVLGYFWENVQEDKFKDNFIVATNYGSSDYLYNKIESVQSKLDIQDSLILKNIFGKRYNCVKSLEIEPIVNIYNFIGQSQSNRELFKLLSDDVSDVPKFIEDPVNSRNYPYHIINLIVEGEDNAAHKSISDNFFIYLNNNEYYNKAKEISLKNTILQIDQNQEVRQQIDAVVNSVANQEIVEGNYPIVSIKDNQVIDDLLKSKDLTLNEDRKLRTQLENQQKVIQVVDANYQIEFDEFIFNYDKKFLLPFVLILFFSVIFLIKYFVNKSQLFLAQNKN